MRTQSRTVVITGAGGVIGRALTHGFLVQGDSVVAIGRTEQALNELDSEVRASLGSETRLHICLADLLDSHAPNQVADFVEHHRIGEVILVNGARDRRNLKTGLSARAMREAFQSEFELGVSVPFELSMELSRRFEEGLAAVVNIGSQYGLVAQNPSLYEQYLNDFVPHYGATRAALFHLTRELSVRLAGLGTRVNAVAVGGIRGRVSEEFEDRYRTMLPLGRMLEPADVVGPILFLCSWDARAITGHTLCVTGGWEII